MKSLERIKKPEQRQLFINNYACETYDLLKEGFQKKNSEQLYTGLSTILPNYYFYKDRLSVRRKTMKLSQLH